VHAGPRVLRIRDAVVLPTARRSRVRRATAGDAPVSRVACGADLLSNSAATAADVRDPVGDDQSSWVLQIVPAVTQVAIIRHETSSPAIVGPREALDD
jgi:hypothetical protein